MPEIVERKAGEQVPQVDPDDIARAWTVYEDIERTHPGQQVGVGISLLEHACSPGAYIDAVAYRTMLLRRITSHGPEAIRDWKEQRPTNHDLFRAAALTRMEWMQTGVERKGLPLDENEFMRLARGEDA